VIIMPFPRYPYPAYLVLSFVASLITGRRRSFSCDSQLCVERIQPPLRVLGEEHIPIAGPCLITFNHYFRPGFHAWCMALAIAARVPVEMHWVMTAELTFPGKWYAPLGRAGSHWLLKRVAHMYRHTTMPPMPPRPGDVEARARSVREVLAFVHTHPHTVLGLAPEGGDQPGGVLHLPAPGAGRFALLLAGQGFPILPVGAFEEAGEFCLSFGPPYRLQLSPGLGAQEKDHRAAQILMSAIALQLPARLRGEFG
jgi:hypothetical protein